VAVALTRNVPSVFLALGIALASAPPMTHIRKILIATDFSPQAAHAQQVGVELAQKLDAKVTLLYVFEFPSYVFLDGATFMPSSDVISQIVFDADAGLTAAKATAAGIGHSVEAVSAQGKAQDVIPGYAIANSFDLIVMGTHGRRGLGRLVMGSVAENVVRTAKVPVLTVPSP